MFRCKCQAWSGMLSAIRSGHSIAKHQGSLQEVVDHECIQIRTGFETVGIEVDQLPAACIQSVEVESGAGHRFSNTPSACEPSNKGGFSCSKITVQGQYMVVRNDRGQFGGQGFGGFCAVVSTPSLRRSSISVLLMTCPNARSHTATQARCYFRIESNGRHCGRR